jgi:hypothetical protein
MSKKSFKIFLDSNNTASWTGILYKANYYIDLTQIIQNNEEFLKVIICIVHLYHKLMLLV